VPPHLGRVETASMRQFAAFWVLLAVLAPRTAGGARPGTRGCASLAPRGDDTVTYEKSPPSSSSLLDSASVAVDLADWMAEDAATVYPRTLLELTLPGTHDSGAYFLTPQLMPDARFPPSWAAAAIALAERLDVPVDRVITPWALTQTLSVGQQLSAGFRYVDIRAGWNGTAWCAHHAEVGVEIARVLRDVSDFLDEHPGEFVVAQVSHLDGDPGEARVRDLRTTIGEILRGKLVRVGADARKGTGEMGVMRSGSVSDSGGTARRREQPSLNRTVGEMVAGGERALVVFGDGDYALRVPSGSDAHDYDSYPRTHLWPPWTLHNSYANSDDTKTMTDYVRARVAAFAAETESPPGALFKMSWTLTTQTRTVLESALPGRPRSLRELDAEAAPLLAPFANDIVSQGCRAGNILSVDFAERSDAVAVARTMNALPVGTACALGSEGSTATGERNAFV